MELRHLRYFLTVAETGNLSRAAEKLFIAQPPLSVQVRQLEQALGAQLFLRHPKGVRLTPAGEALLPEARFLLERAAALRELVHRAGSGLTLSLGYVPSASSTVLPDLVRRLRKHQPSLRLELREMISSEQAEALIAGHLDAGLARSPARHPRLVIARQMPDPFCLALQKAAPKPDAGPVDLRRYAEHDFVGFTRHRGPAYFDRSIHVCAKAGFSPRIRYEASTVHGVLDLVAAGLGVALVPASAALLPVKGVRIARIRQAGQGDVLALLRRKADRGAAAQAIEEIIEEIFRSLQARVSRAVDRIEA